MWVILVHDFPIGVIEVSLHPLTFQSGILLEQLVVGLSDDAVECCTALQISGLLEMLDGLDVTLRIFAKQVGRDPCHDVRAAHAAVDDALRHTTRTLEHLLGKEVADARPVSHLVGAHRLPGITALLVDIVLRAFDRWVASRLHQMNGGIDVGVELILVEVNQTCGVKVHVRLARAEPDVAHIDVRQLPFVDGHRVGAAHHVLLRGRDIHHPVAFGISGAHIFLF